MLLHRRDRYAVLVRKSPHRLGGIRIDDATTGVYQWPLRLRQHRVKALTRVVAKAILGDGFEATPVTLQRQDALAFKCAFPILYVLRNVYDDRPRTPGARKIKSAAHGFFEQVRVGDEKYVFCDGEPIIAATGAS